MRRTPELTDSLTFPRLSWILSVTVIMNHDVPAGIGGGGSSEQSTAGLVRTGVVVVRVKVLATPYDQSHAVITDGLGTYGTNDYVTAARTPDGTLAIAYIPSSRAVTVDLSTFSGSVTARWYDPTAGTFTSASESPFPNAGSQQFTTPGTNAGGDDDWVLVLEAA